MARTFDIAGKSGQSYRYTVSEGQPIWPSGGNFLYVKMTKTGPRVIFAGETESLFRGYLSQWDEARTEHGATDIFLRLNVAGAVRRAERDDVAAKHRPPMNKDLPEDDEPEARASADEGQGNGAAP